MKLLWDDKDHEFLRFGGIDDNVHKDWAWVGYTIMAIWFICYLILVFLSLIEISAGRTAEYKQAMSKFILFWNVPQFKNYMFMYDVKQGFHFLKMLAQSVSSLFVNNNGIVMGENIYLLWIFGDNIEYAFGRRRFALFCFLSGLLAVWLMLALFQAGIVPLSGATAITMAVIGAYLRLFPKTRMNVYRKSFIIPLTRVKMWQLRVETYVFWSFVFVLFFSWAGSIFKHFLPFFSLQLVGLLLGYWLAPYFSDPSVILIHRPDDTDKNKTDETDISRKKEMFSVYDGRSKDPNYKEPSGPSANSIDEKIQVTKDYTSF